MLVAAAEVPGTTLYVLVTHVDPADGIRELNEDDNCVRIPITLTGLDTDTPSAALGDTATSCA